MGDLDVTRLRAREELDLVERVGALVDAGVPLYDAFALAGGPDPGRTVAGRRCGRGRGRRLRHVDTVCANVHRGMRRGESVGEAFAAAVRGGDPMLRAMLLLADEAGDPAEALKLARAHLHSRLARADRFAGAAIYPTLVVALTVCGVVLFAAVVPPAVERFVSTTGLLGPESAGSVAAGSSLLAAAAIGAAALGAGAAAVWRARGRSALRLPLVGRVTFACELLSFATVLSGMLAAGAPMASAIRTATASVSNHWLRGGIGEAARRIERGEPAEAAFTPAFGRYGFLARWFALAGAGADLGTTVAGMAGWLRREVDRLTDRLAALAEPVLVLAAGGLLFAAAALLVRPLFELYGALDAW